MRTLHWPLLSPLKASRRLDGGERKSSIAVAASSWVSRIAARVRISDGIRRDLPVAKKRSVSEDANVRITRHIVNTLFTNVKKEGGAHLCRLRRTGAATKSRDDVTIVYSRTTLHMGMISQLACRFAEVGNRLCVRLFQTLLPGIASRGCWL